MAPCAICFFSSSRILSSDDVTIERLGEPQELSSSELALPRLLFDGELARRESLLGEESIAAREGESETWELQGSLIIEPVDFLCKEVDN